MTFGKGFNPFNRTFSEPNMFMSKQTSQKEDKLSNGHEVRAPKPYTNPLTSALRQISENSNQTMK